METLHTLGPNLETAGQIGKLAHVLLQEIVVTHPEDIYLQNAVRTRRIGTSGVCGPASDAVTRAAHELGIVASREDHVAHYFTSFGPLESEPGEDDLILCMTWGQFNSQLYRSRRQEFRKKPFFGPRRLIRDLIPKHYYAYDPDTIRYRQIIHCKYPSSTGYRWLKTTPEDIASGNYHPGEAQYDDFPPALWA